MKIVSVRWSVFKSSAWLGSFLTRIDSLTLLKRALLVFFQVKLESLNLLKGPSFKAPASHILWSVKSIDTAAQWLKKKPCFVFLLNRPSNDNYVGVQSWKFEWNRRGTESKERNMGEKNTWCRDRESNPGPVNNWPNVFFDKSGPLEDTV